MMPKLCNAMPLVTHCAKARKKDRTWLTWVSRTTVGTEVVSGHILHQFLENLLVARLLAFAESAGHVEKCRARSTCVRVTMVSDARRSIKLSMRTGSSVSALTLWQLDGRWLKLAFPGLRAAQNPNPRASTDGSQIAQTTPVPAQRRGSLAATGEQLLSFLPLRRPIGAMAWRMISRSKSENVPSRRERNHSRKMENLVSRSIECTICRSADHVSNSRRHSMSARSQPALDQDTSTD
jgi:hypothetical protein